MTTAYRPPSSTASSAARASAAARVTSCGRRRREPRLRREPRGLPRGPRRLHGDPVRLEQGRRQVHHLGRRPVVDGQLLQAPAPVGDRIEHVAPRGGAGRGTGLRHVADHRHRPHRHPPRDQAPLHRRQLLGLVHHGVPERPAAVLARAVRERPARRAGREPLREHLRGRGHVRVGVRRLLEHLAGELQALRPLARRLRAAGLLRRAASPRPGRRARPPRRAAGRRPPSRPPPSPAAAAAAPRGSGSLRRRGQPVRPREEALDQARGRQRHPQQVDLAPDGELARAARRAGLRAPRRRASSPRACASWPARSSRTWRTNVVRASLCGRPPCRARPRASLTTCGLRGSRRPGRRGARGGQACAGAPAPRCG